MSSNRDQEDQNDRILATYLGVDSIRGDNSRLVKGYLWGALWEAITVPAAFYARFGVIDGFAIGFTVFLVVLSLLFALGLYFKPKREYHTEVPLRGTLGDRIGAFWLVACAFGPLLGWFITVFLSAGTWRWQYYGRAFCAIALPLITALPLIHYVRGRAALISAPLLIVITALPISSSFWVIGDLHDGPKQTHAVVRSSLAGGQYCQAIDQEETLPCTVASLRPGDEIEVTWLPHTWRELSMKPISH